MAFLPGLFPRDDVCDICVWHDTRSGIQHIGFLHGIGIYADRKIGLWDNCGGKYQFCDHMENKFIGDVYCYVPFFRV